MLLLMQVVLLLLLLLLLLLPLLQLHSAAATAPATATDTVTARAAAGALDSSPGERFLASSYKGKFKVPKSGPWDLHPSFRDQIFTFSGGPRRPYVFHRRINQSIDQ